MFLVFAAVTVFFLGIVLVLVPETGGKTYQQFRLEGKQTQKQETETGPEVIFNSPDTDPTQRDTNQRDTTHTDTTHTDTTHTDTNQTEKNKTVTTLTDVNQTDTTRTGHNSDKDTARTLT